MRRALHMPVLVLGLSIGALPAGAQTRRRMAGDAGIGARRARCATWWRLRTAIRRSTASTPAR